MNGVFHCQMNVARQHRPKNKFTLSEDALLKSLVLKYGENKWDDIANILVGRNARQCRDRWEYYLSPKVNNAPWTDEEEARLVKLVNEIGFHWVRIARLFPGRTDTQIKNKWNVLKRRMDADVPIPIPADVLGKVDPAQSMPAFYQAAVLQQGYVTINANYRNIISKNPQTLPVSQPVDHIFGSDKTSLDDANRSTEDHFSKNDIKIDIEDTLMESIFNSNTDQIFEFF